jgi:hypothetical protein
MNIKDRIKKLEASMPKVVSPLENLTEAELEEQIFLIWQRLYGSGIAMGEEHLKALCWMPRLRQFVKVGEQPWLFDSNHRLDVFSGFRQRTYNLSLPNPEHQERIDLIFRLGCRGVEIPPSEIEWMMTESATLDLGDESPWLREYMEGSGLSKGSTVKIQP